jgi:hypothetical protein
VNGFLATAWSVVAWLGLVVAIVRIAIVHRASERLRTVDPRGDVEATARWRLRALAALGFAITWTFMVRMALDDVARYPNVASWANQSNLFFDAYRRVTSTPPAWFWSQHLMGWALAGSLWFAVEGRRRALPFWAYSWVAMCVAVSVALPLFAERLRDRPFSVRRDTVPVPIVAGIALAALALAATPFVTGRSFVGAMLVLHGGVLVPALITPAAARTPAAEVPARGVPVRGTALAVAAFCFALHLLAVRRLFGFVPSSLLEVVQNDPAQSSITSDVVLTGFVCTLFVAKTRGPRRAVAFALLAPLVSLGAAFAWAFLAEDAPREARSS